MTNEVTVWNLALSAVGGKASISSPTEVGREADLCRLHYPLVRDLVMKAASWPCARGFQRLAVVAVRDPDTTWSHSALHPNYRVAYSAPSDMLAPRYLTTFERFTVGNFDSDTLIYCNTDDAILHYTKQQVNPALWDTGLFDAIWQTLAARICVPLSGKDGRGNNLYEKAYQAVVAAQTEVANESDEIHESSPSWITAGGYDANSLQTRYFHPYEEFRLGGL